MDNAVWLGGTEINVFEGFWRRTANSTEVIECPSEKACLGGFVDKQLFPVKCLDGHSGFLCSSCTIENGVKYERVAEFQCAKCPDPVLNAIRVVGVVIIAFVFLLILISINIKKRKESQMSILLRIFTNYLQLISAALSFNMSFPSVVTDLFYPIEKMSSSDTFLSFDCFIEDYEVKAFTPSSPIFKIFLTAVLPIILIAIIALMFTWLYFIYRKWFYDLKRNIIVSIVCIIFLLHPTLTRVSLSIFQWIDVDEGVSRVRVDLDIEWYSSTHVLWMLALGLPMMVFWVFGSCLLALFILIRNRHRLEDGDIKRYFLPLYQGFKQKAFYWEFVNTLRKVLILLFNVLLASYHGTYRAMAAIIILLIIFRVQLWLQPYKKETNNNIEILAILTGSLTLFCGIIFISDETRAAVLNVIILILVFTCNVYFILNWILLLLMTFTFKSKLLESIIAILCVMLQKRSMIDERQSELLSKEKPTEEEAEPKAIKTQIGPIRKARRLRTKPKAQRKSKPILKKKCKKKMKEEQKEEQVFWVIDDNGSTIRKHMGREIEINEDELLSIINEQKNSKSTESYKDFVRDYKHRKAKGRGVDQEVPIRVDSDSEYNIPVIIEHAEERDHTYNTINKGHVSSNRINHGDMTSDRLFDDKSSGSFKNAFGISLNRGKKKEEKKQRKLRK